MGWTYIDRKPAGFNFLTFFREEFSPVEIRGFVIVLGVAYLAVKKGDIVFAVVCLIDKNGPGFGYKDMDETMCPYYYDCPDYILDMLSAPISPLAALWRKRCRENISRKE